jgi:hypothetical protein
MCLSGAKCGVRLFSMLSDFVFLHVTFPCSDAPPATAPQLVMFLLQLQLVNPQIFVADYSGRAVYGMNRLYPLEHWDRWFECNTRHGVCLRRVCACVYSVCRWRSCDGLVLRPRRIKKGVVLRFIAPIVFIHAGSVTGHWLLSSTRK